MITLPPVSLSSPLLCLFFCILKLAVRLFSCCFLKLFASFLTATNILPKGRIYPYICMQRHMLVSTTPHHLPFLSRKHAHTTQLPLHACFKEITETSTKREGALANGFIYVPELQLTSIFITHSKRRARVTQEMD